jgi:hypothetical protein
MNRLGFSAALFGMSVLGSAALAQSTPVQLGQSGSWTAYTMDGGKTCYTVSIPRSIEPRNVSRDPIFFIITDWSTRRVKGEPQVVPGYKYKDGSTVNVQIGTDKFTFFTQNDASVGGAWIQNRADEQRLVDAMQHGAQMIVTGTSTRGTLTKDTYTLAGLSASLTSIHKACNM